MKIVFPKAEIINPPNAQSVYCEIERAGRTCYKSENKITFESSEPFVKMLINRGHLSVLEHQHLTVKFTCDRGVSHELVRHRLASFSQESTRYCNYGDKEMEFVLPSIFGNLVTEELIFNSLIAIVQNITNPTELHKAFMLWSLAMISAERTYKDMIDEKITPQFARSVLPNSLKTEIVVTANMREWLLIQQQRTNPATAHPDMLQVMDILFAQLFKLYPVIFKDMYPFGGGVL